MARERAHRKRNEVHTQAQKREEECQREREKTGETERARAPAGGASVGDPASVQNVTDVLSKPPRQNVRYTVSVGDAQGVCVCVSPTLRLGSTRGHVTAHSLRPSLGSPFAPARRRACCGVDTVRRGSRWSANRAFGRSPYPRRQTVVGPPLRRQKRRSATRRPPDAHMRLGGVHTRSTPHRWHREAPRRKGECTRRRRPQRCSTTPLCSVGAVRTRRHRKREWVSRSRSRSLIRSWRCRLGSSRPRQSKRAPWSERRMLAMFYGRSVAVYISSLVSGGRCEFAPSPR